VRVAARRASGGSRGQSPLGGGELAARTRHEQGRGAVVAAEADAARHVGVVAVERGQNLDVALLGGDDARRRSVLLARQRVARPRRHGAQPLAGGGRGAGGRRGEQLRSRVAVTALHPQLRLRLGSSSASGSGSWLQPQPPLRLCPRGLILRRTFHS